MKITEADVKLYKFRDIAPGFRIELREQAGDNYIHVWRDDRRIGCFVCTEKGMKFEYHNSHPDSEKPDNQLDGKYRRVLIDKLEDDEIKDIILRTFGDGSLSKNEKEMRKKRSRK